MDKYRIVTNGDRFRVQRRGVKIRYKWRGWFLWDKEEEVLWRNTGIEHEHGFDIQEYDTYSKAEAAIERCQIAERPWQLAKTP